MHSENHPLPNGWVKEFDRSSGSPFFVDTTASPPRSIWTHPYDDELYLSTHPELGEKISKSDSLAPPSFEEATRRHSFPGQPSSSQSNSPPARVSDPNLPNQKKRGFFGKIKDKAIGTKEERAEAKRQEVEHRRQLLEMRAEQMRNRPQQMYPTPGGFSGMGYGGNMGGYGSRMGMGGYPGGGMGGRSSRFGGGGMGGMALPLVGGLAGGLLLGDLLDGGFGNDYGGGGDFGGGDFGGGGF